MENLIAQGIGFVSSILIILSFQFSSRKMIFMISAVSLIIFSVHLTMLQAYTGAVVVMIGALRLWVFFQKQKHVWARSKVFLFLFLSLFWFFGLLTWQNTYSILPIIAMSMGTLGYWQTKEKMIRWTVIGSCPFWLAYNFIIGSWPGVLNEALFFGSIMIAIVRFDILKHKNKRTILIRPILKRLKKLY